MSEPEPEEEGGFDEPTAPAWMATFGDLMSLLLTFFVLLMSFASMDERRYAAVVGSMRDAFGTQRMHPGHIESLSDSLVRLSDTESTPFLRVIDVPTKVPEREQQRLSRIRMRLKEMKLQRVVQVELSPDGVVVRLPGEMLFAPGSAELRPGAVVLLREVAELIRVTPGNVAVRGHTDATPVARGAGAAPTHAQAARAFATNWALSSARAVAALVHLIDVERIEPDRMRATGFGDTQPLEGVEPEAQRRVEFVFLREELPYALPRDPESQEQAGSVPAPSNEG